MDQMDRIWKYLIGKKKEKGQSAFENLLGIL